jgi:peptidoglycan hydrolase-like protein with peptidoglycan-binding domain
VSIGPVEVMMFLELLAAAKGGGGKAGPPGPPAPGVVPGIAPGPAPVAPGTVPVAPAVAPGTAPPMPPWAGLPVVPSTLPVFPGPGWVPDLPVTPAIAARAAYWNPILWDYTRKVIVKPFVQEQFGGAWLTFVAAWHPGAGGPQTYMATEAWRLAMAPAVAPTMPPPGVLQVPGPVGPEPKTGAWQTNAAFIRRYQTALTYLASARAQPTWNPQKIDGKYGPLTKAAVSAYQQAHALTVDGECGNQTAASLDAELGHVPVVQPAPGAAPVAVPTAAPVAVAVPAPVSPYPGTGAWQTNGAYITRYQHALTYLAHTIGVPAWDTQGIDGKFGPNTKAAVMAFQSANGLTADGEAGAATATAIDAAVLHMGVAPAA